MSFAANGRDAKSHPLSHNDLLLLQNKLIHCLQETAQSFRPTPIAMYPLDVVIRQQRRVALDEIDAYYLECQHMGKHTGTKIQFWQNFCETFPEFVKQHENVFPTSSSIAWDEAYHILTGHVPFQFTAQQRLQVSYEQYCRSSGDNKMSLGDFKRQLAKRYSDVKVLFPYEYKSNYRELIARDLRLSQPCSQALAADLTDSRRSPAPDPLTGLFFQWMQIRDTVMMHTDLPPDQRVQAGYVQFCLFHPKGVKPDSIEDFQNVLVRTFPNVKPSLGYKV